MSAKHAAPDASIYRLSLYHCFLGELLATGGQTTITSRQLAEALGVKEETIRRDVSFVGEVGRPGAGYDVRKMYEMLTEFLGMREEYPIIKVGSAQMLSALRVVFPPDRYGVKPVAYFSENPDEAGIEVGGIAIRHLTDLPQLDRDLGVDVALVACSPGWVQLTLDLLAQAGIRGVLLLTPATRLRIAEGMELHHVRMPCDVKSLACKCQTPGKVTA